MSLLSESDLAVINGDLILLRRVRAALAAPVFPVRWTVQIGGEPDVDVLLKAVEATGRRVSDSGRLIAAKTPLGTTPTTVELCSASMAELGFTRPPSWERVCAHIATLVYNRHTPPEAFIRLAQVYTDQPVGERLLGAMDPMAGPDDDLDVFGLDHGDGGLWLDSCVVSPEYVLRLSDLVVFSR